MPLRMKSGGVWLATPASGHLAVKRSGAWTFVAKAAVKVGPVGSGSWMDSGYQGFPGVPATPTVYGWNYYNVRMQWTAPTSGAPVVGYEAQVLTETGTVVSTSPLITGPSGPSGDEDSIAGVDWLWRSVLSPSTKYQMKVRSKGSTGLFSAWSPALKVQMGHAEIDTPASEYRTRPWSASNYTNPVSVGGWIVCASVNTVQLSLLRINVALVNGSTPFSGSSGGRKANYIGNSGDLGYAGFKNSPWDETRSWEPGPATAWQGIALTGTGWDSAGWRGYGTIYLWGTETYLYEYTIVTPAVPNGYW